MVNGGECSLVTDLTLGGRPFLVYLDFFSFYLLDQMPLLCCCLSCGSGYCVVPEEW